MLAALSQKYRTRVNPSSVGRGQVRAQRRLISMHKVDPIYLEHQLKRWMRPDAHRFIRPDWRRFVWPEFQADHPFALYERKYSAEQPRVPAGSQEGGRWTSDTSNGDGQRTRVAQAGFGPLVADIPGPGGRRCVYRFGTVNVMIPGPVNFRCPASMHWSGTTHGIRLNDN